MMKILVTEASWYPGTGIVKQLCDDGMDVVAVCYPNCDNVDVRAKRIQCSIFEIDEPYDYF